MDGLSTAELMLLGKLFDTGSKMVDGFRKVIQEYTEASVDEMKLKNAISRVARGTVFSLSVRY